LSPPGFSRLNVLWELPETWCETDHVAGALHEVERRLARHGLADSFVFVVTSVADRLPLKHPGRVIVIQTSDEAHEVPAYMNDAFMVFKVYRPFAQTPDNLRVIPLGCNKDVPVLPSKPMRARGTDVFFVGRPEFREEFFAAALPLNERPDLAAQVGEAPGFRLGLSPADYAAVLADTKIALSPRGVSHETFRTYEALRAGCAVIAARHLPSWWTDGWPVIEVDDWRGIGDLVDMLRADPGRLDALSAQGQTWWRERCSPEAVGAYIATEIVAYLERR